MPISTEGRARSRRRTAVVVGSVGCVALALVGASASAVSPETPSTRAALDWLHGQVDAADPAVDTETTIDLALADAALGRPAEARALADALAPVIGDYLDTGKGAHARALALVTEVGADARDVGGRDLLASVEDAVVASGPTAGRLGGRGVDVVDQAAAVRGLRAAGSPAAGPALAYLRGLQCPGGGFRPALPAATASQTCVRDRSAGAEATASVVVHLAGDGFGAARERWMVDAARYLAGRQGQDGAVADAAAGESRSTGLAARALGAACLVEASQDAGGFVRSLQVPRSQPAGSSLAAYAGAVAPSRDALAAGRAQAPGPAAGAAWRATTALAAPGLVARTGTTPLDGRERLRLDATREYVAEGSRQVLTVSNAGRRTLCLTGPSLRRSVVGTIAPRKVVVRMPSGTGDRTYSVSQGPGTDQAVLRVLGRARLSVEAPRAAVLGSRMRVVVRGLASGEEARLKVRAGDTRTTWANRSGTAVFRGVDVVGEPGRRRYVVRGKFGDIRRGSDVVRVVAG